MARERPAWPAPRHERRRLRNLEPGRPRRPSLHDARRARKGRQREIAVLSGKQRDGLFDDGIRRIKDRATAGRPYQSIYGFQPFACSSAATFFATAKLKNLSSGGASLTPALLSTASNALRWDA